MRKTRTLLLLASSIFMAITLASCMTSEEKEQAEQKTACLEAGGRWGRGGIMQEQQCFPVYQDAGKSCSRASDCQGSCMADTRTCSKTFSYGCMSYINDDGKVEEICID